MSIRATLNSAPDNAAGFLAGASTTVSFADLKEGTSLGGRLQELCGRSVLLATNDQLAAALALVELDGVASRIVLGTPDLAREHLPAIVAKAGVDAVVSEGPVDLGVSIQVPCGDRMVPTGATSTGERLTDWVLLTSGTTGAPKMLLHNLATLTPPATNASLRGPDVTWGTFYDIRRYGGLQIFLRAILGGASLVMSDANEAPGDFLARLAKFGATHITGTPSHWRRAVMCPQFRLIAPRYVRLSGEIADQSILNTLKGCYPEAKISHAFASTEAGVAFEVNDGLEGFPASMLAGGDVEMKIDSDSLRIRSGRTAKAYVGDREQRLADADGFVDTGDIVQQRGDRYYFLGRRSGLINIGGLKVYPEEVEAVINQHPAVRMSLVGARRSPITGSIVVADVVLKEEAQEPTKREIMQLCRENLAAHKVPVSIRFVAALSVAAAGKVSRGDA